MLKKLPPSPGTICLLLLLFAYAIGKGVTNLKHVSASSSESAALSPEETAPGEEAALAAAAAAAAARAAAADRLNGSVPGRKSASCGGRLWKATLCGRW